MARMACPRCGTHIEANPGFSATCPACGFSAYVPRAASPPGAGPVARGVSSPAAATYAQAAYPSPAPSYGSYVPAPAYPPPHAYQGHPYAYGSHQQKTSGLAVAGLILGIASIPLFWFNIIDVLIAVTGLVLSLCGLAQVKRNPMYKGQGFAVGGIITSAIGLVLAIIMFVAIINAISGAASYCMENPYAPECQ